jgi:hypothetical protein
MLGVSDVTVVLGVQREVLSQVVCVFPIRLAPGKITTSTGKISVPVSQCPTQT